MEQINMTRSIDLCRNCDDTEKFHCTECGACSSTPGYSHTTNGITMKYPRHRSNEMYCDIADRYEDIVAKRRAKHQAKLGIPVN